MRKIAFTSILAVGFSFAHHGVASLGSTGLEGPGAPLESSTSATLPEGQWLFYLIYGTGGIRLYYKDISLGMGLKVPLWKRLNEEKEQQGGEGEERYRFILTFSTLF